MSLFLFYMQSKLLSRYSIRQHYKPLVQLGLPIVIGQLGIIILGFADTLMVGHYSTTSLAAASFVNNMFNLAIIFSTGFSYGLTPIAGMLYGQGNRNAIGKILRNAVSANSTVAIILSALMGLLYLNIEKLGQPQELLPLIRPYFLILLSSLIFVLIFNAFKQFADAITDTRTPMWILISGNLLNIIGNWLLIYGKAGCPEMGLTGAGISTLISRILMVLAFAGIFFFSDKYAPYRTGFIKSRTEKKEFMNLNKLGLPVGLQMGMETASFSLSTVMVGWLGTTALAAHQIMLTIGQLGFMLYYGMAAAVAVRASNFSGQHDIKNVRQSTAAGFRLILGMAVLISIPLFLLRNHIGSWFTDNSEVVVIVSCLVIPFIVYQFGDGLQCNYSNALRGVADVKPMMFFAFLAYFVISLPCGYIFAFKLDMGITGIWLSFPLGLTSAGLMYYLRFRYITGRDSQETE